MLKPQPRITSGGMASRANGLPGFAHIARYRDKGRVIAKILPGEYYVTREQEVLITVLGSCVAACIRNAKTGIGGMNHFMLPESGRSGDRWGGPLGRATRYGTAAMERLINDILKYGGGSRDHLEVKIFGGSKVLAHMRDIGESNICFVREYIAREGLRLAAADVGGSSPRQVQYFPDIGKVLVRRLGALQDTAVATREHSYLRSLQAQPVVGEIDLFGGCAR